MQTILRKVSLGFVLVLFGGMIAVIAIAGPSSAQEPPRFDHLKCYEAKDELKVDNEFIVLREVPSRLSSRQSQIPQ